MTPTALLAANTPAAANAPTAAANVADAASRAQPRSDFRKPLQHARQQQQQTAQAPAQRDSGDDKTAKTAHRPASAGDTHDQPDHDDAPTSSANPDAASAMLALLGQSIPAQAAPAPPAAADATTSGAAAIAATLTAGLPAQGVTSPGLPADGDEMLDSKGMGDADDNALAAAGDDTDTDTSFTHAMAAMGNAMSATQATTSADANDHSDPLDALRSLAGNPLAMQQPAATQPAAPHALTMQSTVGTPAFAQELGQQVAWLGGQDIKQARIRLHPEDLGQLDVKVSVKQDHVDVSFIAQHPQAVHAVQQTLGQLDTLLAHHGLSLGHAEVGQGGRGNESSQGSGSSTGSASGEEVSNEQGGIASVVAPVVKAVGLLDMFA